MDPWQILWYGCCVTVQDQAGRTPLQCAAYGGYITCMAVLMENNADPNIQDKEVNFIPAAPTGPLAALFPTRSLSLSLQGRTALHWSCNNGYLDAVKLLLGYSAFPNHMEHTEERWWGKQGGERETWYGMRRHKKNNKILMSFWRAWQHFKDTRYYAKRNMNTSQFKNRAESF